VQSAEEKFAQWTGFYRRAQAILRAGRRGLKKLNGAEITRLIDDYQALTADLARARSLGAARETVDQLNRIAVAAFGILGFVHVLDIMFQHEQVGPFSAMQLNATAVIPLDASSELFAIL